MPTHLVAHLQFFQTHTAKQKTAKELPSQRTTTIDRQTTTEIEGRMHYSGFAKMRVQWLIEVQFPIKLLCWKIVLCSEIANFLNSQNVNPAPPHQTPP